MPTSVRKTWDSFIAAKKKAIPHQILNAHFEQTAHSERTAEEKYVKNTSKSDFIKLADFYSQLLDDENEVDVEGCDEEDKKVLTKLSLQRKKIFLPN